MSKWGDERHITTNNKSNKIHKDIEQQTERIVWSYWKVMSPMFLQSLIVIPKENNLWKLIWNIEHYSI